MKILVTGGTGFLGGHIVERLRRAGEEVSVLVRNPSKAERLKASGIEIRVGDLTDLDSLRTAVRGVDRVFHSAAHVSEWGSWSKFQSATVNGTINMLTAATEAGVQRFLHVSTATVYEDIHARKLRVISENAPHGNQGDRAYGNYSKAKVLAEQAVWRFHKEEGLPITIIRPAWVYGPQDFTILPRLIEHLRGPFSCWIGRRNPVVDPIYVTDVAECAYLAAYSEQALGKAYNVSPDIEIRLREFLTTLCKELEVEAPRWSLPYSIALLATVLCEFWAQLTRSTEPPSLTYAGLATFTVDQHYDPSRAIKELGWQPQVSLAQGAKNTAAWLQDQLN